MVKLDRLINVLGGYGARLLGSAGSRAIELRSVAIHDPTDTARTAGDAFLAVGVPSVPEAVDLAAAARASVVLVRGHAPAGAGTATATDRDIPILLIDPAVSWGQLAAVVYGLVMEGRETESGRGPTDLFAVADTVANAVGGPVTIEDRMSRVLAYSTRQQGADQARLDTILGRRVSAELRELLSQRGVFRHLAVSDEPLFVAPAPEHGLTGRVVIAVRVGQELLGSVWVESDEPLHGDRARVLADGASTAALHLLRSRASADLERQVESDLVAQLLEGTPEVDAVISRLGLPGGGFRVIALQAHIEGERHAAVLLAFDRATTGFGWSRPGRSTLFGNTVYTVLPGDDLAAARDWLRDWAATLPPQVVVTAGIGGTASATQLPASRQEADESLALHAGSPEGAEAVAYDESWERILLQRLRTAAAAGRTPARGPIGTLARHDAEHGTRYLATLQAWLAAQGDLGEAAAQLGIHPNTVRYRLRKMTGLANLRLDQPEQRLAMLIGIAVTPGSPDRP